MTTSRIRLAALAAVPLLCFGLAGCGESSGQEDGARASKAEASPSVTTATTPAPRELGSDAEEMADALQAAIPALKDRIQMNEDNDENDLFGRPGQYDQVTFIGDDRLDCAAADEYNGLDTACGVKIERWPSEKAAQARAEDIQKKLKDYGLGAEYDYVVGRLVVRASGDYKPSQASKIQAAATSDGPVLPPV